MASCFIDHCHHKDWSYMNSTGFEDPVVPTVPGTLCKSQRLFSNIRHTLYRTAYVAQQRRQDRIDKNRAYVLINPAREASGTAGNLKGPISPLQMGPQFLLPVSKVLNRDPQSPEALTYPGPPIAI